MKLTFENYEQWVPKKNWQLIHSLLIDLEELNQDLIDNNESFRQLYIDIQTEHNEYSVERTDPCPDYYGFYTLRFEKNNYETVGDEMTIEELDNALLILINFQEFKLK